VIVLVGASWDDGRSAGDLVFGDFGLGCNGDGGADSSLITKSR